jgi:hypothetical protein
MMNLLVLFLPVSPVYYNGFEILVGFPLQCFSVLVGLFISLDSGVSRNPHENQVLLLSVDLVHHSHHLVIFLIPSRAVRQLNESRRITLLGWIVFFVIEIAVLIASASALKIEKRLGSQISLFTPGVTTAHPTRSSIFDPSVYFWV